MTCLSKSEVYGFSIYIIAPIIPVSHCTLFILWLIIRFLILLVVNNVLATAAKEAGSRVNRSLMKVILHAIFQT